MTLENNYMEATAENVMVGGSTPTGDWELGKAGPVMVRYNYFPKILEREVWTCMTSSWSRTRPIRRTPSCAGR